VLQQSVRGIHGARRVALPGGISRQKSRVTGLRPHHDLDAIASEAPCVASSFRSPELNFPGRIALANPPLRWPPQQPRSETTRARHGSLPRAGRASGRLPCRLERTRATVGCIRATPVGGTATLVDRSHQRQLHLGRCHRVLQRPADTQCHRPAARQHHAGQAVAVAASRSCRGLARLEHGGHARHQASARTAPTRWTRRPRARWRRWVSRAASPQTSVSSLPASWASRANPNATAGQA